MQTQETIITVVQPEQLDMTATVLKFLIEAPTAILTLVETEFLIHDKLLNDYKLQL
jgi:hypothetical protein